MITPAYTDQISKQEKYILDNKLIKPSTSPYNSPILIVKKKSTEVKSKWWRVEDYRQLNNTNKTRRCFRQIRQIFFIQYLQHDHIFFFIILLQDSSESQTAFMTPQEHYHYLRLSHGFKISINSFMWMISVALTGQEENTFLYVDDIIVFGWKTEIEKRSFLKPEVI